MDKKLDTSSYKGVRDFFPEDMATLKWMFGKMRETAEEFGYVEYGASILEPSELYKSKTSEEIVGDQMYTFIDRGEREVSLRPEMTPTLARMVAARKRDLGIPIRWYSIPNLFRYEKPQKGRLREHWQFNADIFGIADINAEIEIISLAFKLMKGFGAKESDFEIRINSRTLINELFKKLGFNDDQKRTLFKVLDKKEKITEEVFVSSVTELLGDKAPEFLKMFGSGRKLSDNLGQDGALLLPIIDLIEKFEKVGIKNVVFTPSLVRGFDYYTDIVFEIYDTNPDNRRALFGGGRYDNLLELFGEETLPAVGFGMGDVTLLDFLSVRNLVPPYKPETDIYICRTKEVDSSLVNSFANRLRDAGVNVAVDYTDRKIGDQIKNADKMHVPFIICFGEEEIKSGVYKIKNLATGEEKQMSENEIPNFLKNEKVKA
jgi:histidyl-tRNA synthetase